MSMLKESTTVQREHVHESPAVQYDTMSGGGLAGQDEGHPAGGEVRDLHDVPTEDQKGRDDHGAATVPDQAVDI